MENRLYKVEEKLDKIHDISRDNNSQLKRVNGNIADLKKKDQEHDRNFEKVYKTLKKEAVEREIIRGNLKLYVGIAIGASAGITLIGAILPLL